MKAQTILFNQILDTLENVDPTQWNHYLKEGAAGAMLPYNPISKTIYKNTNKFSLWLFNFFKVFNSNHYATFKQISQAGGKLKKGSKAVNVLFWSVAYRHLETHKFISAAQFLKLSDVAKEDYKKSFTAKIFKVFNFDFIENVEEMNFDLVDLTDEVNKIEEIDVFVSGTQAKIEHGSFMTGSYSPSLDRIKMPQTNFFKNENTYYATLLHELVHWTGHQDRLKRDGFNDINKGNQVYSYEELIAELGSVLLYTDFNLFSELENSCKYLKGWLSNFDGNRDTLHDAFKDANRAVNYLKNLNVKGENLEAA